MQSEPLVHSKCGPRPVLHFFETFTECIGIGELKIYHSLASHTVAALVHCLLHTTVVPFSSL